MSFESITILVSGIEIVADGCFKTSELRLISPVKDFFSLKNLIKESDNNILTFEDLFNISISAKSALISGFKSFNFPFNIAFKENVPLLKRLSFNKATCPAAASKPFIGSLSATRRKSVSESCLIEPVNFSG